MPFQVHKTSIPVFSTGVDQAGMLYSGAARRITPALKLLR